MQPCAAWPWLQPGPGASTASPASTPGGTNAGPSPSETPVFLYFPSSSDGFPPAEPAFQFTAPRRRELAPALQRCRPLSTILKSNVPKLFPSRLCEPPLTPGAAWGAFKFICTASTFQKAPDGSGVGNDPCLCARGRVRWRRGQMPSMPACSREQHQGQGQV